MKLLEETKTFDNVVTQNAHLDFSSISREGLPEIKAINKLLNQSIRLPTDEQSVALAWRKGSNEEPIEIESDTTTEGEWLVLGPRQQLQTVCKIQTIISELEALQSKVEALAEELGQRQNTAKRGANTSMGGGPTQKRQRVRTHRQNLKSEDGDTR